MSKYLTNKTIAIDFDGTITENIPRPAIAPIRFEAIKYIRLLYSRGYKLILWTARKDQEFIDCINRLERQSLLGYFIIPESNTGKVRADFYIDDKAYLGKFNWKRVYKYIVKHIV